PARPEDEETDRVREEIKGECRRAGEREPGRHGVGGGSPEVLLSRIERQLAVENLERGGGKHGLIPVEGPMERGDELKRAHDGAEEEKRGDQPRSLSRQLGRAERAGRSGGGGRGGHSSASISATVQGSENGVAGRRRR